jgi:DNA-binding LacI/PurR family transcriptional regulator
MRILLVATMEMQAMILVCFNDQMATDPLSSLIMLPQRASLVTLTVQSLRQAIDKGQWHEFLPGERELAGWLQVSRQTLRLALTALQKEGVLAVVARKRRRILGAGRAEREGALRVVSVISERPLEAMTQGALIMVDHLRAELARSGMELHLQVSAACFSAKPAKALESLVRRSPAAVWLLVGSLEPMQRWFAQSGLPCLVMGTSVSGMGLPSVDADHRAACRHAGHLLIRQGHQRIALVRPADDTGGEMDTEAGLREAVDANASVRLMVIRHDGSAAQLVSLLDRAMKGKTAPTAYVVARAVHALTVLMHLQRQGKQIPQEVAVICRDDETFLAHTVPEVTRYATSAKAVAKKVFQIVRQIAEGTGMPRAPVRIMPHLVKGETV